MRRSNPVLTRQPVHPTITEEQVSYLVELFYQRVRADARLGPLFDARLEGKWPMHLAKMKDFWSSVLLRTGCYKGTPMPAHMQLHESVSEDFRIWLSIFRPTAVEVFQAEAAPLVIAIAERIAQSLWLGMFASPLDHSPAWMRVPEAHPDYSPAKQQELKGTA